jgi:DNA-binding transcriptional ArsR family regulator
VNTYPQVELEALGDATRLAIFQKLAAGPLAVNEIAQVMPVSRPAVSQHLKVLKDAGLVKDARAGTRRLYQLAPEGVARLRAHFDRMWVRAMSAFKEAVEMPEEENRHGKRRRRGSRQKERSGRNVH